jgi:hypothetical protein
MASGARENKNIDSIHETNGFQWKQRRKDSEIPPRRVLHREIMHTLGSGRPEKELYGRLWRRVTRPMSRSNAWNQRKEQVQTGSSRREANTKWTRFRRVQSLGEQERRACAVCMLCTEARAGQKL